MHIEDLSGSLLDYWVTRAERLRGARSGPLVVLPYSSNPKLAEPIISRERIVITHIVDAVLGVQSLAHIGEPDASGIAHGASAWLGMMTSRPRCAATLQRCLVNLEIEEIRAARWLDDRSLRSRRGGHLIGWVQVQE